MIVGLIGKKSAGKDTVGAILVDDHEFVRVSFADPLKESAAALFDVPMDLWDAFKNNSNATIEMHVGEEMVTRLTFREFLQRYGTEAHRDVFGGTFWTDVAEARLIEAIERGPGERIVFTDCRFPEEVALIRKYGGLVVRVVRPGVDASDAHASEKVQESLVADFDLWNGGTIEELGKAIEFDIMGIGHAAADGRPRASEAQVDRRFTT